VSVFIQAKVAHINHDHKSLSNRTAGGTIYSCWWSYAHL